MGVRGPTFRSGSSFARLTYGTTIALIPGIITPSIIMIINSTYPESSKVPDVTFLVVNHQKMQHILS